MLDTGFQVTLKKKNIILDSDELSKKRERIIEHYDKQSDIFFVSVIEKIK